MAQFIKVVNFPKPLGLSINRTQHMWLYAMTAVVSLAFGGVALWIGAREIKASLSELKWWFCSAILIAGLSLLVHELLHLITHPSYGASRTSKVSFKYGPFVGYADWMDRKCMAVVTIIPFLILGLGAAVSAWISYSWSHWLSFTLLLVATVNVLGSTADIRNFLSLRKFKDPSVFDGEGGFYISSAIPATSPRIVQWLGGMLCP